MKGLAKHFVLWYETIGKDQNLILQLIESESFAFDCNFLLFYFFSKPMLLFWSYHPSRCQEWLGCCRGAWHRWSVHDCAEPKPNIRAEVDLGFPITSVGDWGGNDLSVVFHTCGGVWLVVLAHHLLCTFSVGHFHICARLGGIYETVTDSCPLPPTWAGKVNMERKSPPKGKHWDC